MKHEELKPLIVITHTIACLLLNLTELLHLLRSTIGERNPNLV